MIKPITIYTAICDGCGADICAETGLSGWDELGLDVLISEARWIAQRSGRNPKPFDYQVHYCPKCYTYDDNNNLILKEKT